MSREQIEARIKTLEEWEFLENMKDRNLDYDYLARIRLEIRELREMLKEMEDN